MYQVIPQKQGLQWHLLPGYPTLLKAMLLEMKSREITRVRNAIKQDLTDVEYYLSSESLSDYLNHSYTVHECWELNYSSFFVIQYPDALLNCSGAMLANEKLLSVLIKIIFLKTSVYNTAAVFAALNYVDYWLQVKLMSSPTIKISLGSGLLPRSAAPIIFLSI